MRVVSGLNHVDIVTRCVNAAWRSAVLTLVVTVHEKVKFTSMWYQTSKNLTFKMIYFLKIKPQFSRLRGVFCTVGQHWRDMRQNESRLLSEVAISCSAIWVNINVDNLVSTGTFGQSESWSVHIPSSWMHPAVPYEVLIDPLSLPVHEVLSAKTCPPHSTNPDRTEIDRDEHRVGTAC